MPKVFRTWWPAVGLTLPLLACAPTQTSGPDYSALSGLYQGVATLGPVPARYQLLLNVGRAGRADGVLTRLSNNNVYSGSGTFRPYDASGGTVELKLYQGRSQAGTLTARVQGGQLEGTLETRLFTFNIKLSKAAPGAPASTPVTTPTTSAAPTVSPSRTSAETSATPPAETAPTFSSSTTNPNNAPGLVPVYVVPTPVTPPHP